MVASGREGRRERRGEKRQPGHSSFRFHSAYLLIRWVNSCITLELRCVTKALVSLATYLPTKLDTHSYPPVIRLSLTVSSLLRFATDVSSSTYAPCRAAIPSTSGDSIDRSPPPAGRRNAVSTVLQHAPRGGRTLAVEKSLTAYKKYRYFFFLFSFFKFKFRCLNSSTCSRREFLFVPKLQHLLSFKVYLRISGKVFGRMLFFS